METVYLTKDGYNKLKAELEHMRAVERPRVADAIAEARDKGDLSENAEYDAAKEAQRNLEAKIMQMEMTLANARILDEKLVDTSRVQILSRVHLKNLATQKEVTYTLVSDHEANLKEGKISVGTPIGKALIGHKKGEVVDVVAPAGVMKFEILDISI